MSESGADSESAAEALVRMGAPVIPPEERRSHGRSHRRNTPRSSHAEWAPSPDRPDPVEVLVESNRSRLQDLVPVRYRRMMESPFTFFRGSALVMALDLAETPSSGLDVQLCGDAHLANFGLFASPERSLVFDLNDFDETWPGPFEWDLKRLAASVAVAGRTIGLARPDAAAAARGAVSTYRQWMDQYAAMTQLDVWYEHLNAEQAVAMMPEKDRQLARRIIDKAIGRTPTAALHRLTELVEGRWRIIAHPPLVTHLDDDPVLVGQLCGMLDEYRRSLQADRRALFDHYRLVDIARKVVGVGSVGTRCWVMLFQGPNGGPLFLQAKEALRSAPQTAGLAGSVTHEGERVVAGQRLLQASSDVLLGWGTAPETGHHYYVRQLWDAKGGADIASLTASALRSYAAGCGWALARAHARTGDSVEISGYLGRSEVFDDAVAAFADAYADQTERDHAELCAAAERGVIPVAPSEPRRAHLPHLGHPS